MIELRRRILADPASIAFAQLAEECRRLGGNDEAVGICRTGLARNPGYLSARVTLGRALIELGQLDEAKLELDIVVAKAPENLAAIRALAEIFQRRSQMTEALTYYRRALELARHDRDLDDTVARISQAIAPAGPPRPATPPVSIEALFDFDTLVAQFVQTAPVPKVRTVPGVPTGLVPDVPSAPAVPNVLESVDLKADDTDSLAIVERELRDLEKQRAEGEQRARAELLAGLETWLSAIVADRQRPSA